MYEQIYKKYPKVHPDPKISFLFNCSSHDLWYNRLWSDCAGYTGCTECIRRTRHTRCAGTGCFTAAGFHKSEPFDSLLYVDKVEGIDNSFIRGVDISSYASLIDSGVTFQDWDGNLLDDVGFFTLLTEAGVNWIRIRVWNNPYDAEGNSYGLPIPISF